jgi:hypothetical protein
MIPESGWKATSGVLDGEAEFGRYGYNANTADRLLYVPHGKAADAAEAILLCRQQGIIRSKLDAMEDGRRQRCVRYDAGDGDTAELRARKTEFILKSGPKRRSRITRFSNATNLLIQVIGIRQIWARPAIPFLNALRRAPLPHRHLVHLRQQARPLHRVQTRHEGRNLGDQHIVHQRRDPVAPR